MHIHSRYSDGTMTPTEAALHCAQKQVSLAALADHNTWAGCAEFAAAAARFGITTLNAAEMSCNHANTHIHILAYCFEPTEGFAALAEECRRLMLQMSRDLIALLAVDDARLSLEEFLAFEPRYDSARGGWAGLHYLLDKGIIHTLEAGIGLYRQHDMYYTKYPFPCAERVCAEIRASGGIPVLAHPGSYYAALDDAALEAELVSLAEAGIGGIECYYPSHTERMTRQCLAFCRSREDFWITSGSDFHGSFYPVRGGVEFALGATKTPVEQIKCNFRPAKPRLDLPTSSRNDKINW